MITPRTASGTLELLPNEQIAFQRMLDTIRAGYERFGFLPIETPAFELSEVLLTKTGGETERQVYFVQSTGALEKAAAEPGQLPELALRFDLTVPLARYVAQHEHQLTFPFRRYQMQRVYRGERAQRGRFREFYQCDIDIVGNGSLSALNDAEIPCVIHSIFSQIGIGRFVIRINNRKVLQGLLEIHGVPQDRYQAALRAIDSLEKIGEEKVANELISDAGMAADRARALLELLTTAPDLDALRRMDGSETLRRGVDELSEVAAGLRALGMPDDVWRIDLTIARGLDYYTGTVYETQLVDNPEIGSICSGGRYDDLASNYTRQNLPGVGISIGLTRLLSRLFDAGLLKPGAQTPATVLVTTMDRRFLADYLALASELRRAGIDTEVYTEPKRLGDQLKYADRKGFRVAVVAGDSEFAENSLTVKDLASGAQMRIPRENLVEAVSVLVR